MVTFSVLKHVVKALDPNETIRLFWHGEVQRNAEIHLLRGFQRLAFVVRDHIAAKQQLQPGVGEVLVVRKD